MDKWTIYDCTLITHGVCSTSVVHAINYSKFKMKNTSEKKKVNPCVYRCQGINDYNN